jgi:hypothetical protein
MSGDESLSSPPSSAIGVSYNGIRIVYNIVMMNDNISTYYNIYCAALF